MIEVEEDKKRKRILEEDKLAVALGGIDIVGRQPIFREIPLILVALSHFELMIRRRFARCTLRQIALCEVSPCLVVLHSKHAILLTNSIRQSQFFLSSLRCRFTFQNKMCR